MRKLPLILFVVLFGFVVDIYAQKDTAKASTRLPAVIDKNGDTIAIYTLEDTKINAPIEANASQKKEEWERLYRNVVYLMPYANICASRIKDIDIEMAKMDKRKDRRQYLKAQRDQLSKEYKSIIENNSEYQAKLLIKLIYRQTGKTTYDLIKDYDNGFSAGFWQTLSRVTGMSLKETYDPKKDVMIETAIKMSGN